MLKLIKIRYLVNIVSFLSKGSNEMKLFFSRYSHWLVLFIIIFSFFTTFLNFKGTTPDVIAVILGAIGLVSVIYLAYIVEKHFRNNKNKNHRS